MGTPTAASAQLRYLARDVVAGRGGVGEVVSGLFTPQILAVAAYRLQRAAYLLLGGAWAPIRTLLGPIRVLLRPFLASCDIPYGADIGPGLRILHPSLGLAVNKELVAGERLTLVGGNCLGQRRVLRPGELVLGDGVTLGVGSTVLGPIHIGDGVVVGAHAVVVDDVAADSVVVGIPAKAVGTSARPDDGRERGVVSTGL